MIDTMLGQFGYANFLIVLTVLIFVHELGHFLAARWCGVRVEVFSIGFGKEIVGFTDKKGTRWRISLLPLGGYVKMMGEMASLSKEESEAVDKELSPDDLNHAFHHKSIWQRALIIFAGPLANLIYGVILLSFIAFFYGVPESQKEIPPIIGAVQTSSAAEYAGLKSLDKVISVDGNPVQNFEDLRTAVQNSAGRTLAFIVEREGTQLNLIVRPDVIEGTEASGNKPIYRLGVQAKPFNYRPVGLVESVKLGFVGTYNIISETLRGFAQIFDRNGADLGGPIMIAKLSNDFAQMGLLSFLSFTVLLSINLGILNLFPLPVLDGGHLVLLGVESVMRRPLPQRIQSYLFRFGFALLAGLMIYVTFKDIKSFF